VLTTITNGKWFSICTALILFGRYDERRAVIFPVFGGGTDLASTSHRRLRMASHAPPPDPCHDRPCVGKHSMFWMPRRIEKAPAPQAVEMLPHVRRNCLQHHDDLHRGGDDELVMDYAMSVIVSRALPDARDGLKPVQPAHPVRAARPQQHVQPAVPQVRPHRRRRHRQVAPAPATAAVLRRPVRMAQDFSCATCSSTARATSARSTAIPRRPWRYKPECRMKQALQRAGSPTSKGENRRLAAQLR